MMAIASSLALSLFFFSSSFSVVAADGISKLPSGASSGAFMPFVFGGMHTQKGNYVDRERVEKAREKKLILSIRLFSLFRSTSSLFSTKL